MKKQNKILDAVCTYFDLSIKELLEKTRKEYIVFPRHILLFLMRVEMGMPYQRIGEFTEKLGLKVDHATVIHANKKIQGLYDFDADTKKVIDDLRAIINDKSMALNYNEIELENIRLKDELKKSKTIGFNKETSRLIAIYTMLDKERKEKALLQIETSLKVQNMQHQKLRTA